MGPIWFVPFPKYSSWCSWVLWFPTPFITLWGPPSPVRALGIVLSFGSWVCSFLFLDIFFICICWPILIRRQGSRRTLYTSPECPFSVALCTLPKNCSCFGIPELSTPFPQLRETASSAWVPLLHHGLETRGYGRCLTVSCYLVIVFLDMWLTVFWRHSEFSWRHVRHCLESTFKSEFSLV